MNSIKKCVDDDSTLIMMSLFYPFRETKKEEKKNKIKIYGFTLDVATVKQRPVFDISRKYGERKNDRLKR